MKLRTAKIQVLSSVVIQRMCIGCFVGVASATKRFLRRFNLVFEYFMFFGFSFDFDKFIQNSVTIQCSIRLII